MDRAAGLAWPALLAMFLITEHNTFYMLATVARGRFSAILFIKPQTCSSGPGG
jgi:hypothetical protein